MAINDHLNFYDVNINFVSSVVFVDFKFFYLVNDIWKYFLEIRNLFVL